MKIRENLSPFSAAVSKTNTKSPVSPSQIGKVYAVLLDENTPSKKLFDKYGGWGGIGTIFYAEYNQSSKNLNEIDLDKCKTAQPFFSSIQDYPLIGELVYIIEGPTPSTQTSNVSSQNYYIGPISLWNNPQQNSPTGDTLGRTFSESSDIRNLINFEGDRIIQGRKGNGIRFGSTVKSKSNLNEWSNIGNNGDPITILVNGYVTSDTGSLVPNIEEINKEKSSIYLTSTQALPLVPGTDIINPRVNTIKPRDYSFSQIITNSDRITLNSKKDEILLFSKTNTEINADNIINLNAKNITNINSPYIILGLNKDGSYANEPALLGGKVHDLYLDMFQSLSKVANMLSQASATTSEGNIPITQCNMAGEQLSADINRWIDKLEKITSDTVFLK